MEDIFDYDVFLSFASSDEDMVRPIWQELCLSGLRVFWSDATLKQKLGESWFDSIQSSLERSRHFLLVSSQSSMSSEWVKREYQAFYNHCYSQGGRRLIPLLARNCTISHLPIFLRQLQAVELADPDSVKAIIRLLGGSNLEKLKADLAEKEQENKKLTQEVARLELEFLSMRQELASTRQEKTDRNENLSRAVAGNQEDTSSKLGSEVSTSGSSFASPISKLAGWMQESRESLKRLAAPTEKEVRAAVGKAVGEVKLQSAGYSGYADVNSALVGKKLHDSCQGTEIPVLCSLLEEGEVDWAKRTAIYLLLKFCSCQKNPPELARQALEMFCLTLPSGPDANVAAQAIKQIPLPLEEKWGCLIGQVELASSGMGHLLIDCLSMLTKPEKRMVTGKAVSDMLEVASEPLLVTACIQALKAINYRDATPQIRQVMSLGGSLNKAGQVAKLLADWNDTKSADLVKEAIDRWRFSEGDPYSFGVLVEAYYRLGGPSTTTFISEVIIEAPGDLLPTSLGRFTE